MVLRATAGNAVRRVLQVTKALLVSTVTAALPSFKPDLCPASKAYPAERVSEVFLVKLVI